MMDLKPEQLERLRAAGYSREDVQMIGDMTKHAVDEAIAAIMRVVASAPTATVYASVLANSFIALEIYKKACMETLSTLATRVDV